MMARSFDTAWAVCQFDHAITLRRFGMSSKVTLGLVQSSLESLGGEWEEILIVRRRVKMIIGS